MYETTDQLLAEISDRWVKDPRSNMYKLIDSYNAPLEQISDMANRVEEWRAIADAEGTTLDLFGKDIKTARPTKEDDPYRFLIRLKYLLAKAQGTIPSIVKIVSTALGTDKGIKIWHTAAPRHIGIQIPWDWVSQWPIEKFLLENLQHMLALGYWLDVIVFNAPTHVQAYLGAGSQDRWEYKEHSHSIWWTGWSARTFNHWFFGTDSNYQVKDNDKTKAVWWTGWKEKQSKQTYLGASNGFVSANSEKSKAIWWTGWSAKTPSPAYLGQACQVTETAVWQTKAKWWTGWKETANAGITLGEQTITNATQKLKAE